jgi:hypothetical protein
MVPRPLICSRTTKKNNLESTLVRVAVEILAKNKSLCLSYSLKNRLVLKKE